MNSAPITPIPQITPITPITQITPISILAGTLGQGGAERQLFYILKTLRALGTDVRLLSLTQGEFWEEPIRQLGVPVTFVGESPSRLKRLLRIIAVTRKDPPPVIQSAHFFTNLYVSGTARVLGISEIGAIRNNVTSEIGHDWLGRLSLRQPRWLAANSQAAIKTAHGLGVDTQRCLFLPNVVDTDQFTPPRRRDHGAVKLLAVGRLVPQKRMDRFLRILREVQSRSKTAVSAIIVGDGPQRAELETQARQLKGVEFRGALSNLVPVYQEADVLVLTSDFEGTPNVVMEAMACGLPVVSTAVGGVTEIVRAEETGLLVQPEDESALTNAVLRLVDNVSQREAFGAQGRETIERERSLDSLVQHLESLYRQVLA